MTITSISKDVEQLEFSYIAIHWECKLVQSLRKAVVINKFENAHSLWPRNSNPRYIPHRNSSTYNQKTCVIIFTVLLFILTPNSKQSKNSLSVEWMNNQWYLVWEIPGVQVLEPLLLRLSHLLLHADKVLDVNSSSSSSVFNLAGTLYSDWSWI